jgi:hypothetical protein
MDISQGQQGTSQKRMLEDKDTDVEVALNKWFPTVTGRDVSIRDPMLKSKSEESLTGLTHNELKATDGPWSRWKCRFGIKFKKVQGEKGRADGVHAEQCKSTELPNLPQKICADDIYNADETGLFYRATPDGFLSYRHATLSGSKKAMDCVTLLCSSNMSGIDKWKLLVTGEDAKPLCFKGDRVWAVDKFCAMLLKMRG